MVFVGARGYSTVGRGGRGTADKTATQRGLAGSVPDNWVKKAITIGLQNQKEQQKVKDKSV